MAEVGIGQAGRTGRVVPHLLALGAAVGGAAAIGIVVAGWMAFGESIYLTQLTAFVAGCF